MRLDTAIDVAAEYAAHLHFQDGVPRQQAIAAGVAAVVRAARAHPGRIPARRARDAGVGFDSSTVMGVGSVLSAVGWIRKLVTGG